MIRGAISAPNAKPIAATKSQNSLRPRSKIATPTRSPTVGTDRLIILLHFDYPYAMKDTVFTMRSTPYKFGPGVTEEIGDDLVSLGLTRVLVVTDAGVAATGLPERVLGLIRGKRIEAGLFQEVGIEPTDSSVLAAIEFARSF